MTASIRRSPRISSCRSLDRQRLACDGWNAQVSSLHPVLRAAGPARGASRSSGSLVSRGPPTALANPLTTSAQYQTMPESWVRIEFAHLLTAGR